MRPLHTAVAMPMGRMAARAVTTGITRQRPDCKVTLAVAASSPDERSDIRERSRMSLRSCGLQNGSVLALNFRLIACYPSVVALIRPCSPACYFFATLHFPGASWTRACIFPVIYREPVLVKCTPKVRHESREQFSSRRYDQLLHPFSTTPRRHRCRCGRSAARSRAPRALRRGDQRSLCPCGSRK